MKYTLPILIFLSIIPVCRGEGVEYTDPELHYSIRLPEGWRRLPPSAANRAAEALTLQAGVPAQKYHAWFQRSDKPEGSYPYLLINHQICPMPTLEEVAIGLKQYSHATADKLKTIEGVVSDTKLFEPVIDTRRNMVSFETEQMILLNDIGKVYGKCCVFPGKTGVAQLFFYTDTDNRVRSRADFDSVLSSFHFEPGYEYETGLAPERPTRGFDFSRVLRFGLIGGLLGPLCYALLKSRNPNSPPKLLGFRVGSALLIVLGCLEFLIDPISGPASLTFILGSVVVGVLGFAVSWIVEVKKLPSVERPPDATPPP